MIYVCNHCGHEIPELQTPGKEINDSFFCPLCSKTLDDLLKKARDIEILLRGHFKSIL